jgi:hypothetical protein
VPRERLSTSGASWRGQGETLAREGVATYIWAACCGVSLQGVPEGSQKKAPAPDNTPCAGAGALAVFQAGRVGRAGPMRVPIPMAFANRHKCVGKKVRANGVAAASGNNRPQRELLGSLEGFTPARHSRDTTSSRDGAPELAKDRQSRCGAPGPTCKPRLQPASSTMR